MNRSLAPAAVLALLVLAALAAPAARAEDEKIDCRAPKYTAQINTCADRAFLKADAELNAVFKKVLAKIAAEGGEAPYDAKSWGEAARKAQRAWVAGRDADCKGLVPMEWTGGSGTSAAVMDCMIDKTRTRIRELSERYGINGDKKP